MPLPLQQITSCDFLSLISVLVEKLGEAKKKKKKGGKNHSNFIHSLRNTGELFLGHLSSQLRSRNNSVATKAIPNMEKQY